MIGYAAPYSRYKDTDEVWLPQVPEHWELQKLKHLLVERNARGFPDEPLLAATQTKGVVRKEDFGTRTVVATKSLHLLKLVDVGDFVISLRSFQGGVEFARHRGIISPAYTVLSARDPDQHGFLSLLFKSRPFIGNLTLHVTGIRQGQTIDYEALSRSRIALPPSGEMRAIVRYINYLDHQVNRLVRNKRQLIAILKEQREAVINSAVTGGLHEGSRVKVEGEMEWLPALPSHWKVRRLKQICENIVDCKNRTPEDVPHGDYVVVRTTNIRGGTFDIRGSYRTDQENFETWTQRGAPRPGDVFFTREAPVGEACAVPDLPNLCMGQRMMYFRPDTELLDAEFLIYSIYGPVVRGYIAQATNGSTVGHLRLGQVSSLPILWCPIREQREIVAHIRRELTPIDAAITKASREIELLQEYRSRMVADLVVGSLDVSRAAGGLPELADESPDPVDELDEPDLGIDDEFAEGSE